MFPTPNIDNDIKQELKQQLQTSTNKGHCYLQIFQSPQTKTHAISLLQEINQQTLREIKQQLHNKYPRIITNRNDNINRCKEYCYQFYYLKKDYLRKKSKRDCALFGILAFSVVNLLCVFGLWKVGQYFLGMEGEDVGLVGDNNINGQNMCQPMDHLLQTTSQESFLANMSNSLREALSNYGWPILNFILGSYSSFGLWHSTALFIHSLDTFFHRRKQTKQLKQSMVELMQRQRQHDHN